MKDIAKIAAHPSESIRVDNMAVNEYLKSTISKLKKDPVLNTYVLQNFKTPDCKNHSSAEQVCSWLEKSSSSLMAISGDYGAGKTVLCKKICLDLCTNFALENGKKVLPILIDVKKLSKDLYFKTKDFSVFLKKYCPVFSSIEKDYSFIIILDGLNEFKTESKSAVHLFLIKMLAAKQKIFLTYRTNYFDTEQDCITFLSTAIQRAKNIETIDAAKSELEIKHIEDFSQSDIQSFIKKTLGEPNWDLFFKIIETYDLEDLSKTPIMLSWLLKILPKINNKKIRSRDLIYNSLINLWLKREYCREVELNTVIEIMKIIAKDLIFRNATEISSTALGEVIQQEFLQMTLNQTSLEGLDSMVKLSGFLSRDLTGKYSFKHRSIMEYFFAMALEDKIKENHLTLV